MIVQEKIMWEAVKNCDEQYDGKFFYAVKTTKIFCRPSCKSKTPVRENVSFYQNATSAIEDGFRPCKRCRPDLLEQPDEAEIVHLLQTIIEKEYASTFTLEQMAKRVGMSKFHLQRTFKKMVGVTPTKWMTNLRIATAETLLKETDLSITAIAHEVGYKNASHFNVMFRNQTGFSPSAYRNSEKKTN